MAAQNCHVAAIEALAKLDEKEKAVVREVLEALLLKHDARRWATP